MRKCPQCGHSYPNQFEYCPADGSPLGKNEETPEEGQPAPKPAQIRVKTLLIGIAILVFSSALAFTGAFFYQYWKPKYGVLAVKTTPPGAIVTIDGKPRGVTPLTISKLPSGGHRLKVAKEGYKELLQQIVIMPYSNEGVHWKLEPLIPQLSNEQLAEVEALRKKLDNAQEENILLPPPDDYNVLYFAQKILSIDPANGYALEAKAKLAESVRLLAESTYAREDWLESEKQYKNLALLFPNDPSIEGRIAEIAAKLDASMKDREKQIQDWAARADVAIKAGNLLPPEKDNAFEAIGKIQRLDRNNSFAREAVARLKEQVKSRAEAKIASMDWQGARNDLKSLQESFPEDNYSKLRLPFVESKIEELAALEEKHIARANEEQASNRKALALRQSALTNFRNGDYQKSISDWQEYLKHYPDSDEAYFYLGANYQDQKQLDSAIHNFEKCIAINPNHVLAHLNLGRLYDYHRNNFKQAEEHLRKAKDLGGAEKYGPEQLQSMIQDLQDRAQAYAVVTKLFSAEHKHAFSSCRGTLRFTEEGLEFRTAETDHSFYEMFKGLRAFAIQGNNLAIKTRANKRYNLIFLKAGDAEQVRGFLSSSLHIQVSNRID